MRANIDGYKKLKIVNRIINEDGVVSELSRESGIPVRTLENWVRALRENMPHVFRKGLLRKEKEKITLLRSENSQLKQENDILREQMQQLSLAVQELTLIDKRKELIVQHADQTGSLASWARIYDVPMSTLYYKPVEQQSDELQIKRLMDRIHLEHLTWGMTKIWQAVQATYPEVPRHLIQRYMEEMHLQPACQTSKPLPRYLRHAAIPYRIKKNQLSKANQAWAADLTYIPIGRSFLYLAVVIDWFSRFVVGWALSDTADHNLVIAALQDSLQWGIPEILNNDQGSVYMGKEYAANIELISQNSGHIILRSVNGKGAWRDNIVMERWIRSLKYECLYQQEYDDLWSIFHAVHQYVLDYNCKRPHNSLEQQTPYAVFISTR